MTAQVLSLPVKLPEPAQLLLQATAVMPRTVSPLLG